MIRIKCDGCDDSMFYTKRQLKEKIRFRNMSFLCNDCKMIKSYNNAESIENMILSLK